MLRRKPHRPLSGHWSQAPYQALPDQLLPYQSLPDQFEPLQFDPDQLLPDQLEPDQLLPLQLLLSSQIVLTAPVQFPGVVTTRSISPGVAELKL